MLSRIIGKIVLGCSQRAWLVLGIMILLVIGSIGAIYTRLGVTTDTSIMFSPSLDWRQRSNQLARDFPQHENLLVAIVQGDLPEIADLTAQKLAGELSKDHANFRLVQLPADDPFLEKNGLLFLSKKELGELIDTTVEAQPFLGSLAADPSAQGLFQALSLIAEGVKAGQVNFDSYAAPLEKFAAVMNDDANGKKRYLSWENLLAGNLAALKGKYQFIVTQPVLDFSSLVPGEKAAQAMHKAIDNLEFVKTGQAHVMVTGQVQINDEEFGTVAQGMVAGLVVSIILVSLWLVLAVRTWRVIIPILIYLICGLLFTTAFAALAVGTLNLISVAFAVLYIGIAVDFAIQFSVRFRAQIIDLPRDEGLKQALLETAHETGPQIFVAALTTSAGFLAFTPTPFVGVAQLGIIAGGGMLIAFICTIIFLPALLYIFKPSLDQHAHGFTFMRTIDHQVRHYRKPIMSVFALLGIVGVVLIPFLRFDSDPLHTKNPNSEGMRALSLLVQDPHTSPYNAELMVNTVAQGREMEKRMSALSMVGDVIWLYSFVPEDQPVKLSMLASARQLLFPTLIVSNPVSKHTAEELREAAKKTAENLGSVLDKLPQNSPLRVIQKSLSRLARDSDDVVLAANEGLTRFLPMQLDRLRLMLAVDKPVTVQDIPPSLSQNFVAPDGRFRMEIHPKGSMQNSADLKKFVQEIYSVSPDVSGAAIDVVESANTIISSFVTAALSALFMIAFILLCVLRKVVDILLVMVPLLLSALLTVVLIVAIPEVLNFANIIALPLLLGVGVSFNIYFAMNWRAGLRFPLSSPTARAVLFSALTTGTAFGSLAASHHPGTASMGRMLLLSLGCTLICTLGFLPAFLPHRKDIDVDDKA